MVCALVQPEKALYPIVTTLDGILILRITRLLEKASAPIFYKPSFNVNEDKFCNPAIAYSFIVTTVEGIT